MDVIALVLIAFAHIYYAHGIFFDRPIALGVLKQDLQILGEQFPSANRWPMSRIIKYDDKIQFLVDYDQPTAKVAGQKAFIVLVGMLSIATFKQSHRGGQEIANLQLIRKLFVDKTHVYFDDINTKPVQNLEDYYIVDYYPVPTQKETDKKPVVEYLAEKQFEREIIGHIPRIRHEGNSSTAEVIKTYIRMQSGHKINVRYHRGFDIAVFEADFYCLVNNNGRNRIEKAIHFKKLSYDFEKLLAPDLLKIGYTYAVRVSSSPSRHVDSPIGSLKMVRDILLKDVLDSISTVTKSSDVVGVIKYDSNKILTLNNPSNDQKFSLALNGRFITSDGIDFSWLCIALPEGQWDGKSVSALKDNNFLNKPVFFSCPEEGKDSHILFQEDTDLIEIASEESKTMDVIQKLTNVEPFIEYISFQQFRRTLEIVSDVMTVQCLEGYPKRSYRLFVDVVLNYECNTKHLSFEALSLWFRPGQEMSVLTENIRGVSYDPETKRFQQQGKGFSGFKLRQVYPAFQDKIPSALRVLSYSGTNDIAFDLKSFEWDLYTTRDNLLRNMLPQWGVVHVDSSVLFVAEKSKLTIDGAKKWAIVVKCKVPNPDSCTQRECMEEDQVIYDGTKIIVRNSQELDRNPLPAKVYWPETHKLPPLNEMFSVSYRINYIKLATFRKDMNELAAGLRGLCVSIKGNAQSAKLILHVYYPHDREPMLGYYACALNYIFFTSNFKIIKFPTMHGGKTTAASASSDGSSLPLMRSKELQTTGSSRNDHTKYLQSEYVLQDLHYDPLGDVLQSESMSLTEVYALRLLPTNLKVTSQNSTPVKLQLEGGPRIEVY